MILRNKVIDSKEKHHSVDVIKIRKLKCGGKLTAHPQSYNGTIKEIVFYSPDYEKKLKYPKKAK